MGYGVCGEGNYYCVTDQKCKPIPKGHKVLSTGELVKEGNLHKWFKSKSKDGKRGWVNVVTGGTCASDEPGEGTPKCVSSAKRASMTKAERLSAQRRKKKADPNQQQKSGAAKPTYVPTDKPKKKVSESAKHYKSIVNKGKKQVDPKKNPVIEGEVYWSSTALDQLDAINERQKDSDNQRLSQERGRSNYGKASIRNVRATGKGGNAADPAERGAAIDARRKAHKEKRGVKTKGLNEIARKHPKLEDNPYSVKNKLKMVGSSIMDRVKQKARSLTRTYEGAELTKANINYKTTKKDGKTIYHVNKNDEADAQKALKNDPKYILGKTRVKPVKEGAAWTRKAGKNKSGGLNEKGRKSYERENPGSDLKAPSKKVGNPRRKSFCARMRGMKKKLTSAKTARDPDSRINKSLRAWNCSYEWPKDKEMIETTSLKNEIIAKAKEKHDAAKNKKKYRQVVDAGKSAKSRMGKDPRGVRALSKGKWGYVKNNTFTPD